MPIHKLTAEFVINTPLFMSGADQQKAELRVSSIKGAIRFWWRALNYAKYDGNITAMKADEDRLFGSTKGQSQVLFSLTESKITTIQAGDTFDIAREGLGLRYLGYGVMEAFDGEKTHAGKLIRPCIKSGSTFTLQLLSKREFDPSLLDTIKLFGLVGGIGSRARKGYGSVTLLTYNIYENDTKKDDYKALEFPSYNESIEKILVKNDQIQSQTSIPEITAFYQSTQIYLLNKGVNSMALLDQYGSMMLRYRSAGRSGKINDHLSNTNINSEERFMDDHDWHKDKYVSDWRKNNLGFHPERAVFGLPHSYFSATPRGEPNIKNEVTTQNEKKYGRRASPLFFHIHKLPDNSYVGISLIMKSKFLPKNESIKADGKSVPEKIKYKILTDFLIGYKRDKPNIDTKERYFPDHEQIHLQTKEDKT